MPIPDVETTLRDYVPLAEAVLTTYEPIYLNTNKFPILVLQHLFNASNLTKWKSMGSCMQFLVPKNWLYPND